MALESPDPILMTVSLPSSVTTLVPQRSVLVPRDWKPDALGLTPPSLQVNGVVLVSTVHNVSDVSLSNPSPINVTSEPIAWAEVLILRLGREGSESIRNKRRSVNSERPESAGFLILVSEPETWL